MTSRKILPLRGTTRNGVEDSPAGNVPAVEGEGVAIPYSDTAADEDIGTAVDPTTTEGSGGSQSFSLRSPYLGINFIVAPVGVFPSRN